MEKMKIRILVASIIAIVIALGIFGYFRHKSKSYEKVPDIVQQLIDPYRKALAERDFRFAYDEFTSSRYKNEHSFSEFLDAQLNNYSTFGRIVDIKPASGLFIKESLTTNPWDPTTSNWIFKGTLLYEGEFKDSEGNPKIARIMMDIVLENGEYKIYDTYNSFVTISSIKPQIF